jgi:hypothetical protein
MFKRLAKSRFAGFKLAGFKLADFRVGGFRPLQPRRAALRWAGFFNETHSNDNLPGFRRPVAAGKRRSPTPALACHWFNRDGRLECCWHTERNDAPPGGSDEQGHSTADRASGRPPTRSRHLALAG